MLEIECAGEPLVLLTEKAVFWPREKAIIIADLHLGKSAAFRMSGIAVPENTTRNDLSRLSKIMAETGSHRLIVIGDFFHARAGLQPEMLDAAADWRQANEALEIILIPGNHDRSSGPPPASWRIQEMPACWNYPPFVFCHQPKKVSDGYLLAGHVHPAITLRESYGGGLRAPCFWFGQNEGILPAFGSFTGMANIELRPGERCFAINPAENQIVEVTPPLTRARGR